MDKLEERLRTKGGNGGWLGPCTTGWKDLPEVDLPAHLRPSLGPVKGKKR